MIENAGVMKLNEPPWMMGRRLPMTVAKRVTRPLTKKMLHAAHTERPLQVRTMARRLIIETVQARAGRLQGDVDQDTLAPGERHRAEHIRSAPLNGLGQVVIATAHGGHDKGGNEHGGAKHGEVVLHASAQLTSSISRT